MPADTLVDIFQKAGVPYSQTDDIYSTTSIGVSVPGIETGDVVNPPMGGGQPAPFASPVDTGPLFTLDTGAGMLYLAQYEAYAAAVPIGGTFNTAQVGTGVTFLTPLTADCAAANKALIGTVDVDTGDTIVCAEFVIGPGSLGVYVGTFVQGGGPAFDPNTPYGGPSNKYYRSDGELGGNEGYDTFGSGDVMGVLIDAYGHPVHFFKNGVYIGSSDLSAYSGVYIACGTWS